MKPLLLVLLAASLLANAALLVRSRRPAPPPAAGATSAPAGGAALARSGGIPAPSQTPTIVAIQRSEAPAAASAAASLVWPTTTQTDQDLHRVVAGLRAAGFPATVIRAVVNQLLTERFAARSPTASQPFWKRSVSPTPETVAAHTALGHERQTLFEALLGPDARPSAMMDSEAKERRYGTLADDKIDAIARIERDYHEMSAEVWAKRRGNSVSSTETMMQTQQLMEKEKLADLNSVLTPEELAQYEMRNSSAARTLISNLRNVEITEAEFTRLFQAQKAFEAANPRRTTMDQASYAQRQASQLTLNEQARAVLGDARFYAFLEGADGNFANIARALEKYPAVTPTATYQVYQLQVELQSQMAQATRSGPPTPEQLESMRSLAAAYSARLDTLLGPEVAETYRGQGAGRIFSPFRPTPRPASPATASGTPLVPLGK